MGANWSSRRTSNDCVWRRSKLASTEGFTRSATDVFIATARTLLAQSGNERARFETGVWATVSGADALLPRSEKQPEEDLFLRVEYDGRRIAANGTTYAQSATGLCCTQAGHSNRES